MKHGYWVKISKTVRSPHDVDKPWMIKVYTPASTNERDYVGVSRTKTFEQAIHVAHQNIEYEMRLAVGTL